jgi:hypothetical protein
MAHSDFVQPLSDVGGKVRTLRKFNLTLSLVRLYKEGQRKSWCEKEAVRAGTTIYERVALTGASIPPSSLAS